MSADCDALVHDGRRCGRVNRIGWRHSITASTIMKLGDLNSAGLPVHKQTVWLSGADDAVNRRHCNIFDAPVMIAAHLDSRGRSPRRMFSRTVSAMSSALCPVAILSAYT